jgi:hypothetical protein
MLKLRISERPTSAFHSVFPEPSSVLIRLRQKNMKSLKPLPREHPKPQVTPPENQPPRESQPSSSSAEAACNDTGFLRAAYSRTPCSQLPKFHSPNISERHALGPHSPTFCCPVEISLSVCQIEKRQEFEIVTSFCILSRQQRVNNSWECRRWK